MGRWANRWGFWGLATALLAATGLHAIRSSRADEPVLKAIWTAAGSTQSRAMKSWSLADLSKLKTLMSQERDPVNGSLAFWKGISIGQWVDRALEELPLDQRSQVDLVILKNTQGKQAIIPRYLIRKFPLLLAREKNHHPLQGTEVVVPWSSRPQILKEGLPLEAYLLNDVSEVELTSYQSRYASFFIKRRTDPAAIRGEKLFVTNCISCHATGRGPDLTDLHAGTGVKRTLASTGHPKVQGSPKLGEREVRALNSYLDLVRSQSQTAASPQAAEVAKP